jgi:isochorismate hydrolase
MKPIAGLLLITLALPACISGRQQAHQATPVYRMTSTTDSPTATPPPRIDADRVGVVLIDAQPAFWDIMHGQREPVMQRIEQLLVFTDITQRPLVATFEDSPERNGWLPERLENVFPEHGQRHVKRTFDCCREPEIREVFKSMNVEQIVLAGAETDVCVLQSALGLLEMGYEVFLLEDCLFTNEPNTGPALRRLYGAGAIPCTYKTFFFEMTRSVAPDAMPELWRVRMQEHRDVFRSPYALAPLGE